MKERKLVTCSVVFATLFTISHGCEIINNSESLFISTSINDTLAVGEEVITLATDNIDEIINVAQNEDIRGGPYFDLSSIENSQFVVRTSSEFARYEEIETLQMVSLTLDVRCAGNVGDRRFVIRINIIDTNNNKPEFIPTNELQFDIIPPLPPGYFLTGCCNDIINVRDIDLTTQSINFTIEDNPYFEIIYDGRAAEKEFVGQIRTKTLIRSLSEPITLIIFATDVDLTDDPSLTANGTLRITATDTEFQLPEEPMFNQTFYLANYTDDHQLNMLEIISLRQGFDEYVIFTLEDYYAYFELKADGNQISIEVVNNLPSWIWSERQIYLIVRAEREFTSGASTTVIVQLPEEIELQFERAVYQGVIENNTLNIDPLVLSQGYDGVTIATRVVGEHASYFTTTVDSALVTLTMEPLIDDIIDNNSFISLEVVATSGHSSASAVVNLEIIKEDRNTPVFHKFVYSGSYDSATGLRMEEIRFEQGFDTTVSVNLSGDDADYFEIAEIGEIVIIRSLTIPPEMFSQQNILITLEASKPQTVGAHAALYVTLPAARQLEFDESTYRGSIEGSLIRLQTIRLLRGYDAGVSFNLSGEYASHFTITNDQENVTIDLPEPLPDTATANTVILLTLTASGLNSIATNTSILLDVIKDDTTTPVFSQPIYYGTYSEGVIDIEPINLVQGLDSNVTFRIDGDQARYFTIDENATISLQLPITEDDIFTEKLLLFNVFADKAFTVGAHAAVLIRFPADLTELAVMKFSQHTYIGILDENEFNLEQIVLDTGFAPGTEFIISGEHAESFSLSNTSNIVSISLDTLPDEVKEENDFIVLELEARRPRAVSVWTSIIVHIVKQEIIAPVFGQAYYTGSYTEETGLMFEETINLSEGYDETVTFSINGAPEAWFSLEQNGEYINLVSHTPVPPEVLESNNQLLFTIIATKANTTSGRAVIYLDLTKNSSFKFQQSFYRGNIENGSLELSDIILEDYTNSVNYSFTGDYVEYFLLSNQNGTFSIEIDTSVSNEILDQIQLFVLTLEVHNMRTTTHTVIVIENIKTNIERQQIEFEYPFYVGSYSTIEYLHFDAEIRLAADSNQDILFDLEGDDAIWFNLEPNGNSVTVILERVITPGVIENNQQLVFVVTARSPGSATARATVVISLVDSSPETIVLGFEHVSYLGFIENNQVNISSITLREGFTQDVNFTLHGDLKDYFSLLPQGAIVTISLEDVIPENLIPASRIIVLEIQASALEAITAYATIVIDYIADDDVRPVAELVFAQTFYNGSYAAATGLIFPTAISLTHGYNSEVLFDLEGDDAIWFDLVSDENSVLLILDRVITPGVIENNQQLVVVVTARSPGSATARATVVISLVDSSPETIVLGFEHVSYLGFIENNQVNISSINLREGFTQDVNFTLHGDLKDYFSLLPHGAIVTISLEDVIPENLIPASRIIVLEIQASALEAITAYATIVIDYIADDDVRPVTELVFAQTFYNGSYAAATGLIFPTAISLTHGYNSEVLFDLEGDDAIWFDLVSDENSVLLILDRVITPGVIENNQQLVVVVTARSPGSATARATVVISLVDSSPETIVLGFEHVSYLGFFENNQVNIASITLREGFTQDVNFTLHGDLKDYFSLLPQGAIVTISLEDVIPENLIPASRIIVLEIQASAPKAITAYATIVIDYIADDDVRPVAELVFAQTFYNGSYAATTGLIFPTAISLTRGYNSEVLFDLEGDDAIWFDLVSDENSVLLILDRVITPGVIENNQQLVVVVTARSPGSATARATVVISLVDSSPETIVLGFEHVSYLGFIENNQVNISSITLREGFTQDVNFTLHGDLKDYFSLLPQGAIVTISLEDVIPEILIPASRIIVLEIQASALEAITAYATIVIDYIAGDDVRPVAELIFAQTFYNGSFSAATGLMFPTAISLTQGYNSEVLFDLEGDDAIWFDLVQDENSVTVILASAISLDVVENSQQLVFVVTAQNPGSATARTVVIIHLEDDLQPGLHVMFEKNVYEGFVRNDIVSHEIITVIGFSGSTVELLGEYSSLFDAALLNDRVTVTASGSLTLPSGATYVILEICAGTASAVLVLDVIETDIPPTVTSTVTFDSPSYAVRVDVSQTGLVGKVQASADNGEAVTYLLQLDDAHLQQRLSINAAGELRISAPLTSGFYTFEVVATTVFSLIQGTAPVRLSVEAVTVCGDELVMPPLIVINVDEEEPHRDLINGTRYDDCHFALTSHWPLNQTWVYVDQEGLHTIAIDREHESIAFMAQSQVQVEVILHCERDSTRIKRSLASDVLGPYEYGSKKWILADTILYNARRSIVNIIVNDINDNAPIFLGKENEPIAVGYPVPELVEIVLPRSLAELKATDADIGENADLLYWSAAPELAVSPTTGFVHLRVGATLENGARLTINVTDRHGEGLTGSIDIMVKLLDENYVAVVTIRNAFFDDEETIVSVLSEAVGYEIKVLRSEVISYDVEMATLKNKQSFTSAVGASLQLYVYGLINREPVSVERLLANIATAPVSIASSVSLQDHLEGQEICVVSGRDTGLLVATIVLSVFLFVILVLIAVWFFLRWRKNKIYNEFTDENSLASRNASVDQFPKLETLAKPRLDIAELKKSEKRLQERLDAPVEAISNEPTSSTNNAIVNIPENIRLEHEASFKKPELNMPIVIQSIDKLKDAVDDSSDDEFGEIKTQRRKSVVTFNENVEKIIHVEDTPDPDDPNEEPVYEVNFSKL